MTKMVMNGIAFGACMAGIAAIDIAEKYFNENFR